MMRRSCCRRLLPRHQLLRGAKRLPKGTKRALEAGKRAHLMPRKRMPRGPQQQRLSRCVP